MKEAYEVANRLGPGFLGNVYEAALHRELAIRDSRHGARCH
jgi:hypothetical protein